MCSPAKLAPTSVPPAPGDLRPTILGAKPGAGASADLDRGQVHADALVPRAPVDLGPATATTTPIFSSPGDLDGSQRCGGDLGRDASVDLDGDQRPGDTPSRRVPASSNGTGRRQNEDQGGRVGAESSPGQDLSDDRTLPAGASSNGQVGSEARGQHAVGSDGNGLSPSAAHSRIADPSDALLVILADQLDDIEKARIAAENRLRSLAQVKGLAGSKAEATLQLLTEDWQTAEKRITLELERAMRKHRFGKWVKQNKGLGEKQAARLIAAIGDPLWNGAEDRPRRGPAELWAYCGYRPDQGKRKGQLHSYNWEAKMRAFLCAEAALKAGVRKLEGCDDSDGYDVERRTAISPLGQLYLDARASWADREVPDAHKHTHALRVTAKEILKDLWRYAASSGTNSEPASPAATDQLRTAKLSTAPRSASPSNLQATESRSSPNDAASPDPESAPAPPERSGA